VRLLHAKAYNWTPPDVRSEWDLRRLYPEHHVELEPQELRQHYSEDRNLEIPNEGDKSEQS
jgi:hypothetical protein